MEGEALAIIRAIYAYWSYTSLATRLGQNDRLLVAGHIADIVECYGHSVKWLNSGSWSWSQSIFYLWDNILRLFRLCEEESRREAISEWSLVLLIKVSHLISSVYSTETFLTHIFLAFENVTYGTVYWHKSKYICSVNIFCCELSNCETIDILVIGLSYWICICKLISVCFFCVWLEDVEVSMVRSSECEIAIFLLFVEKCHCLGSFWCQRHCTLIVCKIQFAAILCHISYGVILSFSQHSDSLVCYESSNSSFYSCGLSIPIIHLTFDVFYSYIIVFLNRISIYDGLESCTFLGVSSWITDTIMSYVVLSLRDSSISLCDCIEYRLLELLDVFFCHVVSYIVSESSLWIICHILWESLVSSSGIIIIVTY